MAEIAAVTAARSTALATDAERLRDQQEQARIRRELERQADLERQDRAVAEQRAADQRRLEVVRNERRVEQENRRFFLAQEELSTTDLLDERLAFRQDQIAGEIIDARDFRAAEDARALNAPAGPEPATVAAPAVEAPPPTDDTRDLNFRSLEDARDARVAERRAAERDAAQQQRQDLLVAENRIAGTPPTPGLPRGSIVDVFT